MSWLLITIGFLGLIFAVGSVSWGLLLARGRAPLPPPPDVARLARERGPEVIVAGEGEAARFVLSGEPAVTARWDKRSWVIEARVVPLGAVSRFTAIRNQRSPAAWLTRLPEPQKTEVASAVAACLSVGDADIVSLDDDGELRVQARELTAPSMSSLLASTRALAVALTKTRPALEADLSSARSPSSSPVSISSDVTPRGA